MKTKITAEEECNVPAAAQLSLAGQKLNFADTAHFNIYITLTKLTVGRIHDYLITVLT